MARKPAEGGTEHDGRRCNEQRCQSAKKKKVPSSSQNEHQPQEWRYKTNWTNQATKLQMSFRYVEKVWKIWVPNMFFPYKTTYLSLEKKAGIKDSLKTSKVQVALELQKNMAASPLKGRVPAILVVGPGEKQALKTKMSFWLE